MNGRSPPNAAIHWRSDERLESTQVGCRTNDWTLPEPVTPSYLAAAPMRPFRSSSQNGSDLKPDMKFNNILPGD